jgi:hypothetical protein
MKWDFLYYVGIFGVPVTDVLGIHKTTKIIAQEKKC